MACIGLTIALIVVVFIALAIGSVVAVGAPIFAIPIFLVLALMIGGGLISGRAVIRRQAQYRRMRSFRAQAKAQRIPPSTPEDRRTVV